MSPNHNVDLFIKITYLHRVISILNTGHQYFQIQIAREQLENKQTSLYKIFHRSLENILSYATST